MSRALSLPRLGRVLVTLGVLFSACQTFQAEVSESREQLRTQARLDGKARIRIMAANITSGNDQSYDSGEGLRIFQGVQPDIVLIQEFNYSAGAQAMVSDAFGNDFHHFRGTGHIPNGVISRWPIVDAGEWDDPVVPDRNISWARIDVPGARDLWAISVHFSTTSASNRSNEGRTVLDHVAKKVPDGDYLVLGGDFNTSSRGEPVIQQLNGVFVTAGPYPSDGNGNDRTNASRAKPYDWVLADRDLAPLEIPLELGSSTYTNGLVVDTRVYSPLGDISPAKQSDSGATNMQHMAVVRDFAVPTSGSDSGNDGSDNGNNDPPPVEPEPDEPPSGPSDGVAPTGIVISEVLANEPGSDPAGEFIELYNAGTADADLSGWTLSDSALTRHAFAGVILPAGGFLVVYGSDASTGTLALSNGGDSAILRDASGTVVDRMTYSDAGLDGTSLARSTGWMSGTPTPYF